MIRELKHPVNAFTRLFEEIDEYVPCKNRLRVWAAHNSYTLIFLSIMFAITWVIMVVLRFLP